LPSDSLRIDLFHGPDSGYFLQLDFRSDTATGSGTFWFAMHPERDTEKPVTRLRVGDEDIEALPVGAAPLIAHRYRHTPSFAPINSASGRHNLAIWLQLAGV